MGEISEEDENGVKERREISELNLIAPTISCPPSR